MTQSLGSSELVPSGQQLRMVIKVLLVAVISLTQHHKTHPPVITCQALFWGWR